MALAYASISTSDSFMPEWRRFVAAAVCALLTATVALAQDGATLKVTLTALGDQTVATLGTQSPAERGASDVAAIDAPLVFSLSAPAGVLPQAALRVTIGELGDVVVLVESASLEFSVREDVEGAMSIAFDSGPSGKVDVYNALSAPASLLVSVRGGSILLPRGNVRVRSVDAGVDVATSQGVVAVFGGALPEEGVKSLSGGKSIDASSVNALMLRPDGSISEARSEDLAADMIRRRSALVQRSLLPDLVKQAEAVAEGDIEPPTRGARLAAAVALEIRVPEIVPRGGIVQAIVSGAVTVAQAPARSTAEAFVGSGNAAEVVIGARLLRTRVVGAAPGSTSPLRISGDVRRPFTLGRPR